MTTTRITLGWLLTVAAAAVVAGCSGGGDITGPNESEGATSAALAARELAPVEDAVLIPKVDWEDAAPDPAVSLRDRFESTHSSKTISASAGGTIWFGRIALEFQAGALAEDTVVTIVRQKETSSEIYFQLLPDGLEFGGPVTLSVNMSGIASSAKQKAHLDLWDDANQMWVDIGGSWDYPRMTATLDHFSRYRCVVGLPAESIE